MGSSNGSNGGGSGADEAGSSLVPHGPGAQFREASTRLCCSTLCCVCSTLFQSGRVGQCVCRIGRGQFWEVRRITPVTIRAKPSIIFPTSAYVAGAGGAPAPEAAVHRRDHAADYEIRLILRSRSPQVLVVPLPLKPLFPGGIMPVTVTNNKLIKELFEIRKSGWVTAHGPCLSAGPACLQGPGVCGRVPDRAPDHAFAPLAPHCAAVPFCRAQAYVGAFLRRNANARPTTAAAAMQDEMLGEPAPALRALAWQKGGHSLTCLSGSSSSDF